MKALKICLFAFALGLTACQFTFAQVDYLAEVQRMADEAGQRANMHAMNAVNAYRQETGDWSTPDQQVFNYLVAESRRQNPGWYADLQQREQAFQQQQQAYVANRNAQMDASFNGYMDRSNSQYQSHQRYIREGIYERSLYTDGYGNTYEMPYYSPGNVYQANDGSTFIQDNSGQYYQYDNSGWESPMYNYGG